MILGLDLDGVPIPPHATALRQCAGGQEPAPSAPHQDVVAGRLSGSELLKAVVGASPVALVVGDISGVGRRWNHASEHGLGGSAEEVLGRRLPTIDPSFEVELTALRGAWSPDSAAASGGLSERGGRGPGAAPRHQGLSQAALVALPGPRRAPGGRGRVALAGPARRADVSSQSAGSDRCDAGAVAERGRLRRRQGRLQAAPSEGWE